MDCRFCGTTVSEIPPNGLCPRCQLKLGEPPTPPEGSCPCGATNKPGAKFCKKCGKPMASEPADASLSTPRPLLPRHDEVNSPASAAPKALFSGTDDGDTSTNLPPAPPVHAPAPSPVRSTQSAKQSLSTGVIAAIAGAILLVFLIVGWSWLNQSLMREFDGAIAQNNLVAGPVNAYGAFQKAVTEKGLESSMVKDMNTKVYPLLTQKSQQTLDYFAKESELPPDFSWEDMRKIREWMNRISPTQENNALLEYAVARVYLEKANLREALQHMTTALGAKPGWILAVTGMGRIYMSLQDKDQALAFYEQAYRLDPNWVFGIINLANTVSIHVKDYPRAEVLYREALSRSPNRPMFHWYLANHFFVQGKAYFQQACDEYRTALSMPNSGPGGLSPQAELAARQRVAKICPN